MVKRTILWLSALVLLASCNKLDLTGLVAPASAEADLRVRESLKMSHLGGPSALTVGSDDYNVYVCSDVHTGKEHLRLSEFMRRQRSDSTVAMGLCLGDISNEPGALMTAHDIIAFNPSRDAYNTPVYSIVGNHDLFFGQWEDFKKCFGSSTYTFSVVTPNHRDLYIMLDSGGGCHGKTQMEWLRNVLKDRWRYRHCIVCSHVNVFRTDMSQFMSGNLPLEETYELMDLLASHNVELYLQGHDHHRKETLYGGVRYITLDCMKDDGGYGSYMTISVGSDLGWQFHDNI